jgi:hypothetical protein
MSPLNWETVVITSTFAIRAIRHSTLEPHIKGELVARIQRGDLQPPDLERAAEQYDWFATVLIAEFRRVRGR